MGEEDEDPDWLTAFQAPSTSPVMLSSGSDSSPEASPTRITPSREQGNGEKEASSDQAGDRDDPAQNKGKALTFARRKTLSGKKEGPTTDEKQDNTTSRSTPKKDMVTLSSGSDASPGNSPSRAADANHEEDSLSTSRRKGVQQTTNKKQKVAGTKSDPDQIDTLEHQEGVAEDEMQDKLTGNSVSQRLPLMFPDKVQRSKALIECDGDSIDLSGDIGAVGRIVVSNGPSGSQDLLLDLKGTIYKTTIVPSRTFCVVSVGQSEAKVCKLLNKFISILVYTCHKSKCLMCHLQLLFLCIPKFLGHLYSKATVYHNSSPVFPVQIEAIMNDFIQLEPQSNLFEAETMMEGTLDGFTFESDEEGDKLPESQPYQNDQNNEDDGKPKAKTKRKAEKQVGKAPKKAKVAGKAPKKGARKTQPAKRTRKAKK
ncbi:unnamed protein product [Urochloa decumbens]|uniref:DNA-binding protein BIN4 n=1 Tax=Urochloa decumbens TaxID=240449 RepID=A0ABC9EQ60_9POAL